MSRRAVLTKHELRRRLEAVAMAGLAVAEIRPDGTLVLGAALPATDPGKSEADKALEAWLAGKKN